MSIRCTHCNREFIRSVRRINEGKKNNWKTFCSFTCQNTYKLKRVQYSCENSQCNRIFYRTPREISSTGSIFCSRSCAAATNNMRFPKRSASSKTCLTCGKHYILSRRKYCSDICIPKHIHISKHEIVLSIQEFYSTHNRIPFKQEFNHSRAARDRFGTWNKAVLAAGFHPNPVRFAKKYIANDGHICDSLAEKIIDDWFFVRNISHQTKVPYQKNRMTADFKVNDVYIEFLGLIGQLRSYDRLVKVKEKLWKDKNMKIIQIYPRDLFPVSRLDIVLKQFLY